MTDPATAPAGLGRAERVAGQLGGDGFGGAGKPIVALAQRWQSVRRSPSGPALVRSGRLGSDPAWPAPSCGHRCPGTSLLFRRRSRLCSPRDAPPVRQLPHRRHRLDQRFRSRVLRQQGQEPGQAPSALLGVRDLPGRRDGLGKHIGAQRLRQLCGEAGERLAP